MKKGLKKLIAGATTAAILAVPMAVATSGTGNGQEAKALSGFYFYNWDDIYDDWDDRYDFDDYLDDYYDRWDD